MAKFTPKASEKAERLIYCGPSLPGGQLQQHALFKGGTPTHLSEVLAKCPAIGLLIVPVQELTATRLAVSIPGSPEHIRFGQVLDFIQKGGLKRGL